MIRHLFKLAWNRRRANGLIMFELLLAFLVLCGVLTLGSDGLLNWMKPLGLWQVNEIKIRTRQIIKH